MKTLIPVLALTLACGNDETKSAGTPGPLTIDAAEIKHWTSSVTLTGNKKTGRTERTLGEDGKPREVRVYDGEGKLKSKQTLDYNEQGLAVKVSSVAGDVSYVSERSFDKSARVVSLKEYTNQVLTSETSYDYEAKKITNLTYDGEKNVTARSESNYVFSSAGIDGSARFLMIRGGFAKQSDGSIHLETTSDCSAEKAQSTCKRTIIDRLSGKKLEETTTSNAIRSWIVGDLEVLSNNIGSVTTIQFDTNGTEASRSEVSYSHNAKFVELESLGTYTYSTGVLVKRSLTVKNSYDATGLNLNETRTLSVSENKDGSTSTVETVTQFSYE